MDKSIRRRSSSKKKSYNIDNYENESEYENSKILELNDLLEQKKTRISKLANDFNEQKKSRISKLGNDFNEQKKSRSSKLRNDGDEQKKSRISKLGNDANEKKSKENLIRRSKNFEIFEDYEERVNNLRKIVEKKSGKKKVTVFLTKSKYKALVSIFGICLVYIFFIYFILFLIVSIFYDKGSFNDHEYCISNKKSF